MEDSQLEIQGNHLSGYSDEDVKVVTIRLSVIHYFKSAILDKFKSLEELNTFDIEMFEINPSAFSSCSELQLIYIEDEDLSTLPSQVFENCLKLREVTIRNQLVSIPSDAFIKAQNIELLDLSINRLEVFPVLSGLIRLEHLNLAENNLRIFPADSLQDLRGLKKLELRENYFSTSDLPELFFKNLTILEHLDLSKNSLNSLKFEWFLDLKNLTILEIADNNIDALNMKIFTPLTNIRVLYLDHNNIIELHASAISHDNLKILSLNNNFINKIERNFFDFMPKLEYFAALENKCINEVIAGQPINFDDEFVIDKLQICFKNYRNVFGIIYIWIGLAMAFFVCILLFIIDSYLKHSLENKSYNVTA